MNHDKCFKNSNKKLSLTKFPSEKISKKACKICRDKFLRGFIYIKKAKFWLKFRSPMNIDFEIF